MIDPERKADPAAASVAMLAMMPRTSLAVAARERVGAVSLESMVLALRKAAVSEALRRARGNKSKAAKLLRISRQHLQRILRRGFRPLPKKPKPPASLRVRTLTQTRRLQTHAGLYDGTEKAKYSLLAVAASAGGRRQRTVERALAQLKPRHRTVLLLRCGLVRGQPLTAAKTAEQMGLSHQWVHRLERQALVELAVRLQY